MPEEMLGARIMSLMSFVVLLSGKRLRKFT
jgi:hypothetical protein